MATMEIAVDIGTSFTSIYLSGNGIVLREPSVVAYSVNGDKRKVTAVGNSAVEMLGKTPERTLIVSPVVDGVIADADTCTVMLRAFIERIIPQNLIFRPKIKAILSVPMGLTKEEYKTYENVCFAANISEITAIEGILLAAVGIDMPLSSPRGGLIVNIGGGSTEIAALSLCGVVDGCGVSIGGNMMDKALLDFVAGKMRLQVGTNTVRRLKHDVGSLFVNDMSCLMINGSDIRTKQPASCEVYAADTREALLPFYTQIASAVEHIIRRLPPEISGDVYKTGIYLTGGGSRLTGAPEFFNQTLHLPVFLPDEAEYAVIIGGGKLLTDVELREGILAQK